MHVTVQRWGQTCDDITVTIQQHNEDNLEQLASALAGTTTQNRDDRVNVVFVFYRDGNTKLQRVYMKRHIHIEVERVQYHYKSEGTIFFNNECTMHFHGQCMFQLHLEDLCHVHYQEPPPI